MSPGEPALESVDETTEVAGGRVTGKVGAEAAGPARDPADAAAVGFGFCLLAGGWDGPGEDFCSTGLTVMRRSVSSSRNWPLGKKLRKDLPSASEVNENTRVFSLCRLTYFGAIGGSTRSNISLTCSSEREVVDSTRRR